MRKKLTLWMMAVFVPLLLVVAFALTEWSFSLTMEREQNRVQMTESLIARQVQQTIDDLDYTALEEAARQYRSFYAAQGVELLLTYNRSPLGGAQLPSRDYDALLIGQRCAMLDAAFQTYAVAEPLSQTVTLLVLRFEADSLSWRSCARGGGLDATRYYMGDEQEREDTLTDLYKRQGLRPKQPLTALPGDDGVGIVQTNPKVFSGMKEFAFKPCRRLTDEELLTLIQHEIGENIPDAALYNQYEKQTRRQLAALLGTPLSVELIHENLYTLDEFNGVSREIYSSAYRAVADEKAAFVYWAQLDTQTGLLYWADAQPADYEALPDSDLRSDPYDEQWLQIARAEVASLRRDGTEIVGVRALGEGELEYGGYFMSAFVTMADGSGYSLSIPYQTRRLFNIKYYQSVDQFRK